MSKLRASTLRLRLLDRARDHRMLDRLALGHLELLHDHAQALAGEDAQQRVFERQIEARAAGIALAAGAAAQLVVDAPRLVALGADDVQAPAANHLVVQHLPLRPQLRDRRFFVGVGNDSSSRSLSIVLLEGCRPARCRCRGRPCWWRS